MIEIGFGLLCYTMASLSAIYGLGFFAGKYKIPAIGGLIILTFSIAMAVCYNYR